MGLVWGQDKVLSSSRALVLSRSMHATVILRGDEQRLGCLKDIASIFSKLLRFYLNKGVSWMKTSLKNHLQGQPLYFAEKT